VTYNPTWFAGHYRGLQEINEHVKVSAMLQLYVCHRSKRCL